MAEVDPDAVPALDPTDKHEESKAEAESPEKQESVRDPADPQTDSVDLMGKSLSQMENPEAALPAEEGEGDKPEKSERTEREDARSHKSSGSREKTISDRGEEKPVEKVFIPTNPLIEWIKSKIELDDYQPEMWLNENNNLVESFPSNIIANMFSFTLRDFFEVEPAVRGAEVRVDFNRSE